MFGLFHLELQLYCLSSTDERAIQLPKVLLPMIGVLDGGMGERHSSCTSPRSSAHRRDRHRTGSFRRSPLRVACCCCCCLPTPMTLASGGSPMFPHVVHQPASPSIWPAVQSLRRGLSTNPGVTMWCVCGCS